MKFSRPILCLFALSLALFAQNDRGTITGTISDPAGAVVAGAPIEAKNQETGAVYSGAASGTGNYTLPQIPTGTYEISVTVTGFKKYVRQNILVPVAQTVRVDIQLEVGATTESVTVSEAAPLLKTESGELAHNVESSRMDALPVLGTGGTASGVSGTGLRNPYAVLNLLPGADFRPDASIRVNGTPSNTMSLKIEGQESSTGIWQTQSWTQPSVDAIQEFAIQTSNYAAEFGQAGGGVFNTTMRSGTNQFHGSAYDYFANEALNAGQPFTDDGKGHLLRPRSRKNDYGFTLGGPVWIPKVYNGRDRTFFFFNFEQFRETQIINNSFKTVPTPQMHAGDLSQFLTGRTIGTDPGTGLPVPENAVYDPATQRLSANGLQIRDQFPGNVIPLTRFDPVAAKLLAFMPLPNLPGTVNNYLPTYANPRVSSVPSIKADQTLNSKSKISFYWSRTSLNTPAADGMPFPITSARGYDTVTNTTRLNYDYTLRPTMLLHFGVGLLYQNYQEVAGAQGFHPSSIGLKGQNDDNVMPTIAGLSNAQGGYNTGIGPFTLIQIVNPKPTANTSLTWVRGNHTYKFGGELVVDGYINRNRTYAEPWITFAATETTDPSLNGVALTGSTGLGLGSFLLGRVDNGYTAVATDTRLGKHAIAFFAQDSWKITRRLTLDYGLRYDYQTYLKEQHGLQNNIGPHTPNPGAGGVPGGTIFEATCNCSFAHNYPWAFGPRLGVAYQINPKTVFRAGIGVSYSRTAANNFQSYAVGANTPYSAPGFGDPAYLLQNGLPYVVKFPNFDPGQQPYNGIPAGSLNFFDQNAGRPGRQVNFSAGIQREIMRNLVAEISYVGNRGAWWQANSLVNDKAITPAMLSQFGLDINSATDRALLALPIGSPQAAARGLFKPYANFPSTQTVKQAISPYPEYTSMLRLWVPIGDTWYDSMQITLNKRFSHGLDFQGSYTWSKQLTIGAEGDVSFFQTVSPVVNDVTNRPTNKYLSGYDQPQLLVFSGNYTTPRLPGNKILSYVARDWVLGGVFRYGSGLPIRVPNSNNNLNAVLNRGTFANRVPGVPLFLQDVNCHCYDPSRTLVLNPAAWTDPAPGQFSSSAAYYTDYRYQRRPVENMSLGRTFRIKERTQVNIRAEFTNIFNRTEPANPSNGTAPGATFTAPIGKDGQGRYTSGFGYMTYATPFGTPRTGQLVARFTF